MKTLNVKGMHCEACKKIIMMELEEAGLDTQIDRIELGEDNTGIIYLQDEVEDTEKITSVINGMDEYSIE